MANKVPRVDLWIWYRTTEYGWLPDRWEQTIGSKRVQEIKRARVEGLEIDPPVSDSDFHLEEKPGMLIKTGASAPSEDIFAPPPELTDVRYFRIDDWGIRHEVIFENGVEREIASRKWPWALLAGVGILAAFGAYRLTRRRLRFGAERQRA
jgi:hypothetical protein